MPLSQKIAVLKDPDSSWLTALAVVGLSLLGAGLSVGVGPDQLNQLAPVIWALVGMIACDLLRHFARRFSFAEQRRLSAFTLDVAIVTIQLGGIFVLALSGGLSASAALMMIGLACLVSGLGWMLRNRQRFRVVPQAIGRDLRRNWKIGKWVFASRLLVYADTYAPYWILAVMLGTQAAGIFAACKTIVTLANPILLGIGNILSAKAASAFADGSFTAVRDVICRAIVFLVATMLVFCGVVVVGGTEILEFLYAGEEYAGYHSVLILLALEALVSAICLALNPGLLVIERPDVNLKTDLLGLGVLLCLAFGLVAEWGMYGMAVALLIGSSVTMFVQVVAFFRLVQAPAYAEAER